MERKISLLKPQLRDFDLFCERSKQIFETGWVTNNGPFVRELEGKISDTIGVPALALSNGTLPIVLALKGLNLWGEVIVPSFTFCATAHAVVMAGLTPKFVDIDPETFNLDPAKVKEAITEDTCAILGVHVFGNPCNIDALQKIADEHTMPLLFDAAHAFGSTYNGKKIGGFGVAETFSTHATKTLISGEGGFITSNNEELCEYIKKARNFGISTAEDTEFIGTNAKMSELHAIVGLDSLSGIEGDLEKKNSMVSIYHKMLQNVEGISLQKIQEGGTSGYFFFSIIVDPAKFGMNRDELAEKLEEKSIPTRKYFYLPIHKQTAYKEYNSISLPHTELISERILCLPTHTSLTEEDVTLICQTIRGSAVPKFYHD
jgi:dTDP-4-amino-4,6-dideoxygalactose transaminase